MSNHENDCPECGHENCEHTSWMREVTTVTLSGAEMAALIEGQRAQNVALEMRIDELMRKDGSWQRTVKRLNQENARLRNDNVATVRMVTDQRTRIQELESRGTLTDPSATEEALHDKVEKVRAYVKGLRIWGSEDKAQICTDILYIIGES